MIFLYGIKIELVKDPKSHIDFDGLDRILSYLLSIDCKMFYMLFYGNSKFLKNKTLKIAQTSRGYLYPILI
jgi:hypothetical protein